MKYVKTMLFVFGLLLISCHIYGAPKALPNSKFSLSTTEIDLLVGTPEGVPEPLDSRRNTISKKDQIDYSCFLDENGLTEDTQTELKWEDAEDNEPSENQVENQLMDLLAETEELEKTDEIYYGDEDLASSTESL